MSSLTPAQRAAGRWWRDQQQAALDARNTAQPPDESRPPFVRHIRHLCPASQHRSVSFDYTEIYVRSPSLTGQSTGVPGEEIIPAGLFAFIYHEGRCAGCKRTARSRTGRVADGRIRQPVGKVVSRSGP